MADEYLTSASQINSVLLKSTPASDELATKLFSDANYGLSDVANYAEWARFKPGASTLDRTIWELELRTYFGLSRA